MLLHCASSLRFMIRFLICFFILLLLFPVFLCAGFGSPSFPVVFPVSFDQHNPRHTNNRNPSIAPPPSSSAPPSPAYNANQRIARQIEEFNTSFSGSPTTKPGKGSNPATLFDFQDLAFNQTSNNEKSKNNSSSSSSQQFSFITESKPSSSAANTNLFDFASFDDKAKSAAATPPI